MQLDQALWYVKRPHLYREAMRRVVRKLSFGQTHSDSTRNEAQAWCEENCMETRTYLRQLRAEDEFSPIEELFQSEFAEAEKRADNCPLRMGGAANLDLLYYLAEYCRATRVVETGVAGGWSSLALLLSLTHRPGARLISTDMPYPGVDNDRFVGQVVPDRLRSGWTLIRLPDRDGLPKALNQTPIIDMCHYDSDKSMEGRLWAYPRLWSAIRSGGVFVSDDVGDDVAFKQFAEEVGQTPVVIKFGNKYVGVLIKP